MQFSGSYDPSDVVFLLKPVKLEPTPVGEKERLIQSGQRHYSEVIAPEHLPDAEYLALFHAAFERNRVRFAHDIIELAHRILAQIPSPTLLSLARAGTPVGALLKRTMNRLGVEAPHYSLSIIRDRGIDAVAMDWVLQRRDESSVVFIDGWTGKGSIRNELARTLAQYNVGRSRPVPDRLAVVSDLAMCADIACNSDDYLIPNAILNAVVSGLVSRTILNSEVVKPGDFHACVHYTEWGDADLSNWFLDSIMSEIDAILCASMTVPDTDKPVGAPLVPMSVLIDRLMVEFDLTDINRIKPGIAEATRAAMRRVPHHILLRDYSSSDTRHMLHLSREKNIPISERPGLPVAAVTIIRSLGQ